MRRSHSVQKADDFYDVLVDKQTSIIPIICNDIEEKSHVLKLQSVFDSAVGVHDIRNSHFWSVSADNDTSVLSFSPTTTSSEVISSGPTTSQRVHQNIGVDDFCIAEVHSKNNKSVQ